jgi:hypothetical protein
MIHDLTEIAVHLIIIYTPTRRYRKRKGKGDESEEENEQESTTFSDDEVMQFSSESDNEQESSDSEDEEEVNGRAMTFPTIIKRWEWTSSSVRAVESFSSVDGDNIFYTNYWNGYRRSLSYDAGQSLENAQRSLVARQDDKHSLTLEYYPKYLSQVPYRKFHCVLTFGTFHVTCNYKLMYCLLSL